MSASPGARLSWVALGVTGLLVAAPGARPAARGAAGPSQDPPPAGAPVVAGVAGAQDPAWSPDGRRLALIVHERLRLADDRGRLGDPLTVWDAGATAVERDPAWSPDGLRLVFAADRGEGFDLYILVASGGSPRRLTFLAGDERWPSWSADGRIVFAAHDGRQWDLLIVDPDETSGLTPPRALPLTASEADEREPAVSPDGLTIAFVSTVGSGDDDADLWWMPMPPRAQPAAAGAPGDGRQSAVRLLRAPGGESRPAWSPDGRQIVFAALRDGVGTLWALAVPSPAGAAVRPSSPPVLLSRRYGTAAWAPDGQSIVVALLPDPPPAFNGEPRWRGPAPASAFPGDDYVLRRLPAPTPPDDGAVPWPLAGPRRPDQWTAVFDRVWERLRALYYAGGPAAAEWRRLGDRVRPRAAAAADAEAFERTVDELIAEQPLVKPPVSSAGGLVVSGDRLASDIGASVLARGGNVADAAVAVSFALGVAEPDASGIGGDGMALVWLTSMDAPAIVDFKDRSPARATLEEPRIFRDQRLVGDGPAAVNVPGMVAGMDLIHRRFGSGRMPWADLVLPAARLASAGIVVGPALAATVSEGRALFARYPAAAAIYLPAGRALLEGDRLVNPDLAATLREIAAGGANAFYRGDLARRIAIDMAANGGLISEADLGGYHAIEREPLRGTYRGHTVYTASPPVAAGASLIEALQILDHYVPPTPARYDRQADVLHYAIEAWKAREPSPRIADPAVWPVDLATLLSRAHAAARFAQIDARRAGPMPAPGEDGLPRGGEDTGRLGRGTTAFVVADAAGNVVVVTQTLSTWGGSFYVSDGLGFLYNNHLRGYRTSPDAYGHLRPSMRSSSTALPTLVVDERDGRRQPRLAIAAAGNAWIPASIYGVLSAVLDGGRPVQAAIEAPRFLVARDPADGAGRRARVQIEDRFPKAVLDDLVARGHLFRKIGGKGELRYGFAAAVLFDQARGLVHAGTEPRRPYAAAVAEPSGGRKPGPGGAAAGLNPSPVTPARPAGPARRTARRTTAAAVAGGR